GWLQAIADWNPVSALVAACRQLFGNPAAAAAHASWPLRHPVVATIGWSLLLLAVFVPLATRRYQAAKPREARRHTSGPARTVKRGGGHWVSGMGRGRRGVLQGPSGRQHKGVLERPQGVLRGVGGRTHGGTAPRTERGVRSRADLPALPGHAFQRRQVALQD